jgi:hypothetical protein
MQPVPDADGVHFGEDGDINPHGEDLEHLTAALSLTDTAARPPSDHDEDSPDDEHATQIEGTDSALSVPRSIPRRTGELTPGALASENVMTPRNDVGPFVLDGGAGRTSSSANGRRAQGGIASLDAAASEVGLGPV